VHHLSKEEFTRVRDTILDGWAASVEMVRPSPWIRSLVAINVLLGGPELPEDDMPTLPKYLEEMRRTTTPQQREGYLRWSEHHDLLVSRLRATKSTGEFFRAWAKGEAELEALLKEADLL